MLGGRGKAAGKDCSGRVIPNFTCLDRYSRMMPKADTACHDGAIAPPQAPCTMRDLRTLRAHRCKRAKRCSALVCVLLLAPPARALSSSQSTNCRARRLIRTSPSSGFVAAGVVGVADDRRGSSVPITEVNSLLQRFQSRVWPNLPRTSRRRAAAWMAVSAGLDIEPVREQSRYIRDIVVSTQYTVRMKISGQTKSASL